MGFLDRNVLVFDIHDVEGCWETVQFFDTTQNALQFFLFAGYHQALLLGQSGHGSVLLHLVDVGHLFDGFANRRKIGEHTTQPTLGHVGHVQTLSFGLDDFFGLLLGGDKENFAARAYDRADGIGSLLEFGLGMV